MGTDGGKWSDECSVIGDKGEIGYIDFDDDVSVCSYNPLEEGPVVISVPFAFVNGKPQAAFIGETVFDSITIKNTTDDPLDLWAAKIYASNPDNSFTLSVMEPPSSGTDLESVRGFLESFTLDDRMLQPRETLTIWLSCKPKQIGLHTSVVHFDVGSETIERVVFLLADDKISQSLACKKPYSRGMRKKNHAVSDEYVAGSRPARSTTRFFKKKLPWYGIPKEIRDLLEMEKIPDAVREGLVIESYASYFKTLLVMEEIQLEEDMRAYDMESVSMKRKGAHFLSLVVSGLAEKRPSLVHGDYILAKLSSNASSAMSTYQGYVHHVEADEVYLKFAPEFHLCHRDGNSYNVHFTYNRINMRRCYQAIEVTEEIAPEFLFPSKFSQKRCIRYTPLVPISRNLNDEQIRTIAMIIGCKGAPPYLIHGPPGTGKTLTLVEAILQLYTTRKNSRILVCAPSNSAADHILEKLLGYKDVELRESDIFRLNATTRPYDEVEPDHLRFCFLDQCIFKCPPHSALMCYRVIISTYMSASLLYAEGVKRGHFSHVFLDEAGQASEPESMIPISNLCSRKTVVVLAGDPMQLGPVIYSKEADTYGLGKSYLERLFECEYYRNGDENYVTKLVRNYRCHSAILHLPSTLFYRGELLACKDDTTLMTKVDILKLLPNKEFPVLFFGIQGCDEREGNNPSWFNRIEASKVVEFIRKLTASGNLTGDDIGVITPYRQQVLKLKKALESLDMLDIKVGSVEQFQGQEKQVIIISTVRSTIKHKEFDRTYCLGFLSNPRRFNVAITRAISLLLIIGNPHIICQDPYWNKLLWHCAENNSYQGCALPERQEIVNEVLEEEEHLNFNEEEQQPPGFGDDGRDQDSFPTEIPKPVTDEAEWSDGWK